MPNTEEAAQELASSCGTQRVPHPDHGGVVHPGAAWSSPPSAETADGTAANLIRVGEAADSDTKSAGGLAPGSMSTVCDVRRA